MESIRYTDKLPQGTEVDKCDDGPSHRFQVQSFQTPIGTGFRPLQFGRVEIPTGVAPRGPDAAATAPRPLFLFGGSKLTIDDSINRVVRAEVLLL